MKNSLVMALVIAALLPMEAVAQSGGRVSLTTDTTVWFDANQPDDSGDGLTIATAKKTPQAAWDWAADNLDLAGHKLTVASVGPRSYIDVGLLTSKCFVGQAKATDVLLDGNPANTGPSGFSIHNPALAAMVPGNTHAYAIATGDISTGENAVCTRFMIRNWNFAGLGGGINANGGIIMVGDGVTFGQVGWSHVDARGPGAEIILLNNYTIAGGAVSHLSEMTGAMVFIQNGVTVTIGGNPQFVFAFASAQWGGWIYAAKRTVRSVQFVGTVRGRKYAAQYEYAAIDTQTQDETFLPGDQPGCRAQGQYAHSINDINNIVDASGSHC